MWKTSSRLRVHDLDYKRKFTECFRDLKLLLQNFLYCYWLFSQLLLLVSRRISGDFTSLSVWHIFKYFVYHCIDLWCSYCMKCYSFKSLIICITGSLGFISLDQELPGLHSLWKTVVSLSWHWWFPPETFLVACPNVFPYQLMSRKPKLPKL